MKNNFSILVLISLLSISYCVNAQVLCNNVDLDGDGFGGAQYNLAIHGPTSGLEYPRVCDNTDCDDTNADINPNTFWLVIQDGDGDNYFTIISSVNQCIPPAGNTFLLTRDNVDSLPIDCDDNNNLVYESKLFFSDVDGDGFGDIGAPTLLCAGNTTAGYVDNASDECPTVFGVLNGCPLVEDGISDRNYVHSTAYKTPLTISELQNQTLNTDDQRLENITYFDELGRPDSQIAIRQSPYNNRDIVTPITYDDYGRQTLNFLPYVSKNSGGSYYQGNQSNPTTSVNNKSIMSQQLFYNNKYSDEASAYLSAEGWIELTLGYLPSQLESTWDISTETPRVLISPTYSETEHDIIDRSIQQATPGKDWAIDNGHTVRLNRDVNSVDEVNHFSVIFPTLDTEEPQLYYEGTYVANELYKTITKDENWQSNQTYPKAHTTEEFKNKSGQVILKRTYNNKALAHDTYYVYDDFGNLTYVLSPKGLDLILASKSYKSFSTTEEYLAVVPTDKFGNYTTKGSGSINITINGPNNTITVDFNVIFDNSIDLKNGAVIQLNQNIPNMIVGTILNGDYTVSVQDGYLYIAGSGTTTLVNETIVTDLPTIVVDQEYVDDLCYQYHYDKRNRLVEKKIPQKGWEYIIYDTLDRPILTQDALQRSKLPKEWLFTKYDEFDRVAYTGTFISNGARVFLQSYINNQSQLSVASSSTSTIDNKTLYYSNNVYPTSNLTLHTVNYYDTYNATLSTAVPNPGTVYGKTISNDTKSLPTGSLVRVLGTTDWITSVTYYDDKGQPIYIGSKNYYLNTTDIIKTDLDFLGLVIESESSHTKDTNSAIIVTDRFTYDYANRLLTQKQQITGEPEELIVKNEYDELGQMIKKGVGSIEASPLQSVDYTYNIRGWLQQINDPGAIGNDLFSFKINYNSTDLGMGNDALFNGNISETIWKTANDPTSTTRGYAYDYDALNRITSGNMAINVGSGYTQATGYHVNGLLYDKNGNIKSLKRTGETTIFDDLIYKYDGNQLVYVKDGITNQQTEGFIDGNLSGTDYIYDANGNMIEDKNKKITSISYNHLNLPTEVEFNNSNAEKINYIYDATGLKLKKVVNNKGNITNTEYAGSYIYENSTLKFFSQPEGYVEPNGNSFNYVYQYKDHLGNIRLSYHTTDGYRSLINQTFYTENDIEDLIYFGNGGIAVENGTLKVTVQNQFDGIRFDVDENLSPGQEVQVDIDVDKGTSNKIRMYLIEFDDQGNNLGAQSYNPDVNSGHHTINHTMVAGSVLQLKLDKSHQSNDNGNLTHFYIDNVTATTGTLEIVEENNYYPFGLKHKGYNNVINGTDHPYGFGGKEEQDELGLGWIDITARNYDPALGRWMNIDQLAEKMRRHSPYNFGFNNPIYFQDYDGMMPTEPGDGHKGTTSDTSINLSFKKDKYSSDGVETITMVNENRSKYIYTNKDGSKTTVHTHQTITHSATVDQNGEISNMTSSEKFTKHNNGELVGSYETTDENATFESIENQATQNSDFTVAVKAVQKHRMDNSKSASQALLDDTGSASTIIGAVGTVGTLATAGSGGNFVAGGIAATGTAIGLATTAVGITLLNVDAEDVTFSIGMPRRKMSTSTNKPEFKPIFK